MRALEALFAPRAVTVLGVSRSPAKLGYRLLQNVRAGGFAGPIIPVNPSGERILDLPTVATVEALPDDIDLALVSLPSSAVPEAVAALARRGVRAAVVLSSGFGEVDAAGRTAQGTLLEAARAAGLRLIGPNCMGVYSAPANLNGTYFWDLPKVPGGIGVVSQSGAYGGLIFRQLGGRGLGIARFLSIGNQVDVDIADVVDYLADDPATTLIASFVEAVPDGARFVRAAARATASKPVVVLKGGRSDAGRRAAGSHTGSLAGSYEVYRAACRRAGAVLTEETDEFFDAIEALVVTRGRRPAAPRVAVITVSGGPSVVAADCAERSGLVVPALGDAARARLRDLLPTFAAVGNPVDLTPQVDPARLADAVAVVLAEDVAGAVAVNVGLDIPEFADSMVSGQQRTGKPVVAFAADAPVIVERLRAGGVPVLPSPERAVRAWRALWIAARSRRRAEEFPGGAGAVSAGARRRLPEDVRRAVDEGLGPLSYAIARRLLETYGVRFADERLVATADDAAAAARAIGYPVVVKADVPGLAHKTEAGAVRLDVRTENELRAACAELGRIPAPVAPVDQSLGRVPAGGFIVQARVGPGVELLVGARRDEVFGPVVALGTGGTLAEVIGDLSLRLAPLGEDEAREMLDEGLRPRLLAGPRGLAPVDPAAVVALLGAISALIVAETRILEIDLNPVIAAGAEAVAVDALVIVGETGRRT